MYYTYLLHYYSTCLCFPLSDITDCINGTNDICEQNCIELEGGFSCGCINGYRLKSDNVSCEGKEYAIFIIISIG